MSSSVETREVHFVGGPLDGLRVALPVEVDSPLARMIAIPINKNILLALEGHRRGPRTPATSIAVYEQFLVEDVIRCCFLGAAKTNQFHLEKWKG